MIFQFASRRYYSRCSQQKRSTSVEICDMYINNDKIPSNSLACSSCSGYPDELGATCWKLCTESVAHDRYGEVLTNSSKKSCRLSKPRMKQTKWKEEAFPEQLCCPLLISGMGSLSNYSLLISGDTRMGSWLLPKGRVPRQ